MISYYCFRRLWKERKYLIKTHSFRKLPTAIMRITENISESPTVTNETACQCTILMVISGGDKDWQHISWQGDRAASRKSIFRQEAVGRVSQFLSDKKHKQNADVEIKLKRSIKNCLVSNLLKKKQNKNPPQNVPKNCSGCVFPLSSLQLPVALTVRNSKEPNTVSDLVWRWFSKL